MNTSVLTVAEFAARFPRARGHDDAIRYVAIDHDSNQFPSASSIDVAASERAVQVGWTNGRSHKSTTRFAIIPA